MTKRLLELCTETPLGLLEQFALNHTDLWETVLEQLPPQEPYMLLLVSQSLGKASRSIIASLGSLFACLWKESTKCGSCLCCHSCQRPRSPCLTGVYVQQLNENTWVRHEIEQLKSWRYDHQSGWCIQLAETIYPNLGEVNLLERDRFWLSDDGQLSFLDGYTLRNCHRIPYTTLHWKRTLDRQLHELKEQAKLDKWKAV